MALPTIPTAGAGRVLTTNQLNTTATRTFSNLSSLTKAPGDLLIAIIVAYQSSVVNSAFSSWGASFNEFVDQGTATTMAIGAAYKWSDGTEAGTFSVTQAATITGNASMILLAIPNAHLTQVPEATAIANGTAAAADPANLAWSWGTDDTLCIAVGGNGDTNISGAWAGNGSAGPTNYTDYVDTAAADNSIVGECEGAVAFRQVTASSENAGTFAGTDTTNARNSALLIAVRGAPDRVFPGRRQGLSLKTRPRYQRAQIRGV